MIISGRWNLSGRLTFSTRQSSQSTRSPRSICGSFASCRIFPILNASSRRSPPEGSRLRARTHGRATVTPPAIVALLALRIGLLARANRTVGVALECGDAGRDAASIVGAVPVEFLEPRSVQRDRGAGRNRLACAGAAFPAARRSEPAAGAALGLEPDDNRTGMAAVVEQSSL